jgi:phosphoglycolate phosphatase
LRLIIFDCDGTLVDSQNMICAAMEGAYAAHKLALPKRERLLSIVGLSLVEAFIDLSEGDPRFPVAGMVESYKAAFFELRQAGISMEPLYPGAQNCIETLAADPNTLLGIATGKSQRGVRRVMEHHGLLHHFSTIQTADDAPSKPHPAMIEQAMAEAGVKPQNTVVVGDTRYDIAMARAAGARAVGVSWGYHAAGTLREAGAEAVIDDFRELLPLLKQWHVPHSLKATASVIPDARSAIRDLGT